MIVKSDPVFVRRRRVAIATALFVLLVVVLLVTRMVTGGGGSAAAGPVAISATPQPIAEVEAPPVEPAEAQGGEGAPADTTLVQIQRITGGLTPKSVVASSAGLVLAQNMMYSHTVTAYTPDGARVATLSDAVDLSEFGVEGHPGESQGAPVEVAFNPDGTRAWVSNYAMYGEGFGPEGKDACTSAEGLSNSYVYEVDTSSPGTPTIERVIEVGAVPKYVAVTPDGATVLVTNWCSMDLTVIDAASGEVRTTIPMDGTYPRGIAVTPDSATVFVALMGSDRTVRVDLASGTVTDFASTGDKPRHLVMAPDGAHLYVTDSGSGTVTKLDVGSGETVGQTTAGADPRSTTISTMERPSMSPTTAPPR